MFLRGFGRLKMMFRLLTGRWPYAPRRFATVFLLCCKLLNFRNMSKEFEEVRLSFFDEPGEPVPDYEGVHARPWLPMNAAHLAALALRGG